LKDQEIARAGLDSDQAVAELAGVSPITSEEQAEAKTPESELAVA